MNSIPLQTIDVSDKSYVLSTIKLVDGIVSGYTIKQDSELGDTREITEFKPIIFNSIYLTVKYTVEDVNGGEPTSLTMIHKYTYVSNNLLCWIYSFKNRRIYSYLDGAYMGASTMLSELEIDDL
jgi:hypothetical protein